MNKYIPSILLAAVMLTLSTAPAAMAISDSVFYKEGLLSKLSVSYSVYVAGRWTTSKVNIAEDKSVFSNNANDITMTYSSNSYGDFVEVSGTMLMKGGKAYLQFGGKLPDMGTRSGGGNWVFGAIVVSGNIVLDGGGNVVSGTGLLLNFSGGGACLIASNDVPPSQKEGTISISIMPSQTSLLSYIDGSSDSTLTSSAKIKMGTISFKPTIH